MIDALATHRLTVLIKDEPIGYYTPRIVEALVAHVGALRTGLLADAVWAERSR